MSNTQLYGNILFCSDLFCKLNVSYCILSIGFSVIEFSYTTTSAIFYVITAYKFVSWYFHYYLHKSQMGCCMFKQFLYGVLDIITSESFVVHYTYIDVYQYGTRDQCTLKIMGRFLHNIRFRQFLFLSSFLIPVDVAFFLFLFAQKLIEITNQRGD